MKTRLAPFYILACSLVTVAPLSAMAEPASQTDVSAPPVVFKDAAITSSIKAKLAADRAQGLGHVRVDSDDHGVVTLKGHVHTQDAADRAIAIARGTEGVREVKSAIEIKIDD